MGHERKSLRYHALSNRGVRHSACLTMGASVSPIGASMRIRALAIPIALLLAPCAAGAQQTSSTSVAQTAARVRQADLWSGLELSQQQQAQIDRITAVALRQRAAAVGARDPRTTLSPAENSAMQRIAAQQAEAIRRVLTPEQVARLERNIAVLRSRAVAHAPAPER